jgi:hypothetical protein
MPSPQARSYGRVWLNHRWRCVMQGNWEKATSAILGLSAAAFAVVIVHREFFAKPMTRLAAPPSAYVDNWRDAIPVGHAMGDPLSPIKLIEFGDLECPFCRSFNTTVHTVLKAFPGKVEYVFVQFPLPMHRFANPAARALECVAPSAFFQNALDVFYAKQDSLGLRSWATYAEEAGVRDTVAFARCTTMTAAAPMIVSGVAMGKKLGVAGTPTVVLNGWRYGEPPSDTELVRAIGDLLAGRRPYAGFPRAHN